jgi:hypothetical protein
MKIFPEDYSTKQSLQIFHLGFLNFAAFIHEKKNCIPVDDVELNFIEKICSSGSW